MIKQKNGLKEGKKVFQGSEQPTILFHCASLGEFEQARPVIEKLKREFPDYYFLLSFFSPSGYEIQKNYAVVDEVIYLPYDKKNTIKNFLDKYNIKLAVFVKYEFWINILELLNKRNVPIFLFSGIFRNNQTFFKWYGGYYKKCPALFY